MADLNQKAICPSDENQDNSAEVRFNFFFYREYFWSGTRNSFDHRELNFEKTYEIPHKQLCELENLGKC